MGVADKAAAWAKSKIGCPYSQDKRMSENPEIFDCSSLVLRAYKACGYKFTSGSRSCEQVTDAGFGLLWPASQKAVGQTRVKASDLKAMGWTPRAGDILFFCTDSSTTRSNKVTHVAIVLDAKRIIHARSTAYGVRVDAITLYDGKIVAVTRFKENGVDVTSLKVGSSSGGSSTGSNVSTGSASGGSITSSAVSRVTVTGGSVNVRKAVGTQAVILAIVRKGDVLELTGRVDSGWREVRFGDGRTGWVSEKYLDMKG